MSDNTIERENKDTDDTVKEFAKWSEILTVTRRAIWIFWIGMLLLPILKEFTDFEEKAPFLYGKIFTAIMLVVCLVLVTLETLCRTKTRKYYKQIEENENEENDDEPNER